MTLKLPPHEGLVELVQAQKDREGCDQSVLRSPAQVQAGVDTDRGDDEAADQVPLRRETHGRSRTLLDRFGGLEEIRRHAYGTLTLFDVRPNEVNVSVTTAWFG
jgi:hypothetical protein